MLFDRSKSLCFSNKQLYVFYKPDASVRARYKLIQKKLKNSYFPWYSKFLFLYPESWEARDLDQAQTSAMNS